MKTVLMLALAALLVSGVRAADQEEPRPFQLTTLAGDRYLNCRIVKSTPEALTVMHDRGVTKISFELLTDEWRARYRYDPAKARKFAREEAERLREAEERRTALMERRLREEERMMDSLVAKERQRLAEEKALAALGPPLAPAPLPGDATPHLGMAQAQPMEEVVPTFTPITQVYTPSGGTYRTYARDRYYTSGFYPYAYPTYGYTSYYQPVSSCVRPYASTYVPCARPVVSTSYFGAGTVIRVNR